MILELYDKEHENKYPLSNYKNYSIKNVLRYGDKELRITIPINSKYAYLVEEEMYIRNKTQEFVIKEVNPSDNYIEIVAKLNIETIEGKTWETFESKEATITDCINTALAGTWWQVGICNITKKRTIRKDFCNSWEIIKQCVKTYRVEIELDSINKKINIYEQIGTDKGSFFMESLNLRELSVQSNSYDYCTKLIAIGGTVDKEDGTKERISCTVSNNSYSNKVIEQIWKDERYTILEDLREDAQAKLDAMAKPYKSYSAKPYSIGECQLGDTITLISKKNKIYNKFRIVSYTEYPEEVGKDTIEIANSILSFEDLQKEFEEARNTVDNITENNSTISEGAIPVKTFENIYARSIVANKIQGLEGDFGNLNATKANITDLNAQIARIDTLEVNSATIEQLKAANAKIGTLEAGYGQINILQSDVATINNLIAGNVTAGSQQTIVLNAQNTTIANALIKSAMIESINADKINAGSINTDNVTIKSSSGGIQIADNTMQFQDKDGKVRIQIGQDTQNNFNFIVRAEDGTTTLIDGTGVKENAIADNLIKTNMVSDKAIKGTKIDWDDFFTTINADGTHTLNSSKVKLNSNNQTLDVAFNQLNSAITEGGRNLYADTKDFEKDYVWTSYYVWAKEDEKYKGLTVKSYSLEWNGLGQYISVNQGEEYTLSAYVKSESSTVIAFYDSNNGTVYSNKNNANFIVGTEWQRISISFTITRAGSTYFRFENTKRTKLYICGLKLEKGKMATDWSVAPEDIEDKISTNTTAISVQQDKIDTIVSTTEQLTTKSNNNATAINTLNTNYSKISQTVNEINSTVSSHTTTIQGLQTSVNNANSSINQLKDSIELKVNTSTYNTDEQGILTNISNNSTAISQLNNSISLKVEQTDITNAINNLNIGGRNLLKKTKNFDKYSWSNENRWSTETEKYKDLTVKSFSGAWGGLYQSYSVVKGEIYTFSAYVKSSNESKVQFFSAPNGQSYTNGDNKIFNVSTEWVRISVSFTVTTTATSRFRFEKSDTASKLYICGIKLEKGNKATDYTEAPEDITTYTDTKISEKSAEIKTTTDNISSRVTATETTLNANGTGLVSRMSSVEQEITASAITTKISTAINNGTSSINTTYFTQDNTGLTIKNGGIKVLNNVNTQIFGVGTDGYLDMRGAITQYNSNGKKSIEIKSNEIKVYNYKSTNDDLVGGFANVNDFTNTSGDSGIALYGTQGHALSIGMKRDNTITKYITCVDNGDGDTDRKIDVQMETYFRGWGATFCNNDFTMRGFIKADAGAETGLCIIGANALHLGYGSSSSNYASKIDISANGITIWGNVTVVGKINGQWIGN